MSKSYEVGLELAKTIITVEMVSTIFKSSDVEILVV
jgi:hypothetical protein